MQNVHTIRSKFPPIKYLRNWSLSVQFVCPTPTICKERHAFSTIDLHSQTSSISLTSRRQIPTLVANNIAVPPIQNPGVRPVDQWSILAAQKILPDRCRHCLLNYRMERFLQDSVKEERCSKFFVSKDCVRKQSRRCGVDAW